MLDYRKAVLLNISSLLTSRHFGKKRRHFTVGMVERGEKCFENTSFDCLDSVSFFLSGILDYPSHQYDAL